jgi:Flp pilus assembly protein CpaB
MEWEYKDPSPKRGKVFIVLGLILALSTGAVAFFLVNQARQQAGQAGLITVPVVVAGRQIPARHPIEADDVVLREVPVDATNEQGVFTDPQAVIGLVPTVTILVGQPIYANLLASQSAGSEFSILQPGETIGPDTPAWRAVSITVPDDRAVGGLVHAGSIVDVFLTAPITVPEPLASQGIYTSERSTKITYQNVEILQRTVSFYVLRVSLPVAEEISHLQATGSTQFSLALRPTQDNRMIDVSGLGETTTQIIEHYGLPIPKVYPGTGPLPPAPSPSPSPSAPPASPGPSASPGASPAASPGASPATP